MKKVLGMFVFVLAGLCGPVFGENIPVGYPWLTWGEVSERSGSSIEKGFKLDGYAEQGIDWFTKAGWSFNTFIGLRGVISDESENWWNNKIGPWAGIKFKHALDIKEGSWGLMSIGLRWEGYRYFRGPAPQNDDNSAVLFLQWGFGGDWKKR